MFGILLAVILAGVEDPSEAVPLPEAWYGTYVGVFTINGDQALEPFRGELRIAPIEGNSAVTWTLIYGEGEARQVRPYELIPERGTPGQFVIDEKNGVTIDMRLVGSDLLVGHFEVAGSLITARYERLEDAIRCELITFAVAGTRTMEVEGTAFTVASFQFRRAQHGELKRLPPPDEDGPD